MSISDAIPLRDAIIDRADRVWLTVGAIFLAIWILDPPQVFPSATITLRALLSTAPYVAFAVLAIGYLKASGAEAVVVKAFEGRENRMIVLAALIGGLAPFCSCEVIPFIAGLLAVGTPLSAVMAFWLSSPLMDPPSFLITAGALGWPFAIGKAVAAVGLGLFGGFATRWLISAGFFSGKILRAKSSGCCGCGPSPFQGQTDWQFWHAPDRRQVFIGEVASNALFLLKWLTVAYLLESLMLRYVPAEAIAGVVGGSGLMPIVISAFVGAPAYLNGYAAPAIVSGLVEQGMTVGAGMAFIVAGAVTSIPAMTAVFALVRRDIFAAYLVFGFGGAMLSGVIYSGYAMLAGV